MKISNEARIKIDQLHLNYSKQVKQILINEANKNNPFKKGDIIFSIGNLGRIKYSIININEIKRSYSITYKCERLTKKLKPFKSGEEVKIFLDNHVKKVKK